MAITVDNPMLDTDDLDEVRPYVEVPLRPEPPVRAPRFVLRRPSRSGWITAAIGALTAVLYTWNLSAVGYANSYYAAAVKSATVSWKALFFGSIDPGNFITVDKPPAALWLQGLSGRIFGFSSWSMLLPEVAAGVASVLILHHLVRRWRGNTAAHLAAIAFALSPIAVAMFRNNNPDALLTFLGLAAAWALWNALESGRTRPLLVSAALTGLAFNTKMLQAFLVLPAFVLVYLIAGPPKLGKRILQLTGALAALIVSSGWWMAAVALWPATSRPYIGSTTDNSIVSLLLGYNGLDRVFGGSNGTPGGGGGGPGGAGGFGGTPGLLRMFNSAVGGQVSWLIPLATAGLAAGLWLSRRSPRTDRARAGWLLWGAWAFTCVAVFSLSKGIFHPYYTVQLAPAIAALAGAGAVALWKLGRTHRHGMGVTRRDHRDRRLGRRPARPHTYLSVVVATDHRRGWRDRGNRPRHRRVAASTSPRCRRGRRCRRDPPGRSGRVLDHHRAPPGARRARGGRAGEPRWRAVRRRRWPGQATSVDAGLVAYLEANQGSATYLVATFGSQSSASIIIATGKPVITIGGFNGGDPAPTLAQFQSLVAEGKVRFLLVTGNGGGGPGGGQAGSQAITQWAAANGKTVAASAYGGAGAGTLYDLQGAST